jgi:2-C-methyl-D-erythritol 4-phosphate cytidylyltransferase
LGDLVNRDSRKVVAVIAAAGTGKRIGGEFPKQYLKIAGKPVLVYTLEKFDRCHAVGEIVLVVEKEKIDLAEGFLKEWGIKKTAHVIAGGVERQDSIRRALDVLPEQAEWVAIHDGVRPFVSLEKIDEVIQAGRDCGAAILAVPEKNTIKKAKDGWVEETVLRSDIWEVQTPQVFKTEWLKAGYVQAFENHFYSTDDASLLEKAGYRVRLVRGEEANIKITSPADLIIAKAFVESGY